MDSSLNDIWDEPAIEISPKRTPVADTPSDDEPSVPRPSKRPRTSLFLTDSEDDDTPMSGPSRQRQAPPPQEVDIDALFADFDEEFATTNVSIIPDEAALARQAEARHRKSMPLQEILPSSPPASDGEGKSKRKGDDDADDEKKSRRRLLKLDENRLLGPNGFPHLIKMTKDFRIKGKGHEATDLNRLLSIYQFWTHQLYPKTQFRDTVQRVEKLTHSRRMNVALSVWRDEAHGVSRQNKDAEDDENEDLDNADHAGNEAMDIDDRQARPPSSSAPSSRASSPPLTSGAENDGPSRPPVEVPKPPSEFGDEDEDEAFWRSMDDFGDASLDARAPPPPTGPAHSAAPDDDEEMWDIIDEIAQSTASKPADIPPPALAAPQPVLPVQEPEVDDCEDIY